MVFSHLNYLEIGLAVHSVRTLEFRKWTGLKNSNFLYTSLEEFLNDFTRYDSLTFQNYASLFRAFLGICLSLLLAKCDWLFKVPLGWLIRLIRPADNDR